MADNRAAILTGAKAAHTLHRDLGIKEQIERAGGGRVDVFGSITKLGATLMFQPLDKLLGAVEKKRQACLGDALNQQTFALGEHATEVAKLSAEWTGKGELRQPVYLGLRAYKSAKDVVRERERSRK